MSESEFEDDYFEDDEYAETGAAPRGRTYIDKYGELTRGRNQILNDKRNKTRIRPDMKKRKTGPVTLKDLEENNEEQQGEGSGSMPGLFGQNNKLDVNVHITKEHETKPSPEETTKQKKERLKYHISKYTEQDRDIYFIKLVAGSLKRPFESLINVEEKREETKDMFGSILTGQPAPRVDELVVVNIKYIYGNELLFAWSTIIEKVKLMLSPYNAQINQWSTTEDVHLKLINNDTTCVSFSRYVAFIIMKESNALIPRNRTRYVIDQDGVMEDRLAVDLMRALHTEYSILRDDLVNRFL